MKRFDVQKGGNIGHLWSKSRPCADKWPIHKMNYMKRKKTENISTSLLRIAVCEIGKINKTLENVNYMTQNFKNSLTCE